MTIIARVCTLLVVLSSTSFCRFFVATVGFNSAVGFFSPNVRRSGAFPSYNLVQSVLYNPFYYINECEIVICENLVASDDGRADGGADGGAGRGAWRPLRARAAALTRDGPLKAW
jgi:hypothetical protein